MAKKNILHVTNSNALSQYLISIGNLYNKKKYTIIIGCFDSYGPLNIELEKKGIRTFNIPIKKNFLYLIKSINFFFLLKKNKIDILHLHTFYPSFFGVIAGKLAGIKKIVVTRHHADHHVRLKKNIHIFIDSWTARKCDCLIAVSEWTKEVMIKHENILESKIKVVYNGIEHLKYVNNNLDWFYDEFKISKNDITFLCVSRIHKEKNLETAILAINILNKNGINTSLLIAGSGIGNNYFNEINKLIKELGITEKILFLDFRNDIGDLLHNCDALIHPSFGESFGFVVLEAMSQGKTVFASDISALHEVASDDVAYFFNPNSSNELYEKIIYWKKNPIENAERINNGIERYKAKFTFEKMLAQYEELYEL